MSVSIKTCPRCGQINRTGSGFCPTCGASLRGVAPEAAPWTVESSFPPIPASLRPKKRRRRYEHEGQGTGFAWLGIGLITAPFIFGVGPTVMAMSAGAGMALVFVGFWLMRRDRHTIARTGLMTNAVAALTLIAITVKIVTSREEPPKPAAIAVAPASTATETPDWVSLTPSPAIAQGNVPMFRGDAAHTGFLPGPGPRGAVFRLWRADTAGDLYTTPAVVDGQVLVGTKSGFLYSFDELTGNELWHRDLGGDIVRTSPAVDDGRIVVGLGNTVYCVRLRDHTLLWSIPTPLAGSAAPTIANGVVYMAFPAGGIYAFDLRDGRTIWHYEVDGALLASPVVAGDRLIVATDNGSVYALDLTNGAVKWRTNLDGGVFGSPAASPDLVFVTTKGDKGRTTTALELDRGEVRWSYAAGGEASPTLGGGLVFIADEDGGVVALAAETGGDPLWLFPTGGKITTSPVLADGILYLSSGPTLFAVDASNGHEDWRYATGFEIKTSPVVVNGRIYIGGAKGYLDALTGNDPGTASPEVPG